MKNVFPYREDVLISVAAKSGRMTYGFPAEHCVEIFADVFQLFLSPQPA
jgi:hypothetical protein